MMAKKEIIKTTAFQTDKIKSLAVLRSPGSLKMLQKNTIKKKLSISPKSKIRDRGEENIEVNLSSIE